MTVAADVFILTEHAVISYAQFSGGDLTFGVSRLLFQSPQPFSVELRD